MHKLRLIPTLSIVLFLALASVGFLGLSRVAANSQMQNNMTPKPTNEGIPPSNGSNALISRAINLAYSSPKFQSLTAGQPTQFNGYNIGYKLGQNGSETDLQLDLTFSVGDHQVGVSENLNGTQVIGVSSIPFPDVSWGASPGH